MAQTPQSEETGGAGDTAAPGTGRPQGLFGGSTTILLIIFAVAVFWWNRRRRVEMEEQLRAQRREAEATAERSALDVANLMRAAPQPGGRVAAAREGLASAARMPSARAGNRLAEAATDAGTTLREGGPSRLASGAKPGPAKSSERRPVLQPNAPPRNKLRVRRGPPEDRRIGCAAYGRGLFGGRGGSGRHRGRRSARSDHCRAGSGCSTQRSCRRQESSWNRRGDAAVPAGAIAGNGTAICPPITQ